MAVTKDQTSLQLIYSITRELAMALDLHSVLPRVMSLSLENVHGERGSIIAFDESGRPVEGAMLFGEREVACSVDQLRATIERGLAGWVVRSGKPAMLLDTSKDERWLRRPDDTQQHTGPKSAICVPLLARDRMVGVLTIVHSQVEFFNEDHLALMQTIGSMAGIAVENAQLFERLGTAQKRYHELFEDSIDPILITDWQGKILETNRQASKVTGYDIASLAGMSVSDLFTIDQEKTGPYMDNLKKSSSVVMYESKLHKKDAASIPVEVYVHATHVESRDYLQWLLRDITERKNLAALKDDLAAMVYHDLRSPLANVVSSLDMLRGMAPAGETGAFNSLLEIAEHSTQRMQRLVSSLLDVQHLEEGHPISHKDLVTANSLIDEACKIIRPLVQNKKQELMVSIGQDLPAVMVDVDMIRRVVTNLLENAAKYTPSGGVIQVGARQEDGWLLLWVDDSGPGIPRQDHERVFEKFVRLQTEGAPKGMGLGLAFCKLAVNAHGGKIWVESQPALGSRFTFTLPLDNQKS